MQNSRNTKPIPKEFLNLAEIYLRARHFRMRNYLPRYTLYASIVEQRKIPELTVFTRNSVTGRQAVYLDDKIEGRANIDRAKLSYGVIKGACVEVQKGEVYTFVAEGVETTLSIK